MKFIIIFYFLSFFILCSCGSIFKWQTDFPDNIVEEYVEDFIEDQTGYNIDLTPISGNEMQKIK